MTFLTDFFTYPFLMNALFSSILLSILCGLLSPIIVAKKFAFMGASLSHGALLGVAVGLCFFDESSLMGHVSLFFITLLVTLLAVSPLAISTFRQKLPSDALIGLFFTATMGLGLIIHQTSGSGKGDLLGYLFGNILTLGSFDMGLLVFLGLLVAPIIFYKKNEWILFLFDEEAAAIQGLKTKVYHFLLYLLLTLVIVGGLKISGVILINSFLLTPGIFALKWAPNAHKSFLYSVLFAISSTIVGLLLANGMNFPVGATLAVTQVLFYFGSFVLMGRRAS